MANWPDWLGKISRRDELLTRWDNDIQEAEGALADRTMQQNMPNGSELRAADATAKLNVVLHDIDAIHDELDGC